MNKDILHLLATSGLCPIDHHVNNGSYEDLTICEDCWGRYKSLSYDRPTAQLYQGLLDGKWYLNNQNKNHPMKYFLYNNNVYSMDKFNLIGYVGELNITWLLTINNSAPTEYTPTQFELNKLNTTLLNPNYLLTVNQLRQGLWMKNCSMNSDQSDGTYFVMYRGLVFKIISSSNNEVPMVEKVYHYNQIPVDLLPHNLWMYGRRLLPTSPPKEIVMRVCELLTLDLD